LLEPPIAIPEGMVKPAIDPSGVITAEGADGARHVIARLEVARFANPQGLEATGDGLYRETANSGAMTVGTPADGTFAALYPGAIEAANVDLAEEFTTMLVAQRAYSASLKTFQVGDEMLAIATDL